MKKICFFYKKKLKSSNSFKHINSVNTINDKYKQDFNFYIINISYIMFTWDMGV